MFLFFLIFMNMYVIGELYIQTFQLLNVYIFFMSYFSPFFIITGFPAVNLGSLLLILVPCC